MRKIIDAILNDIGDTEFSDMNITDEGMEKLEEILIRNLS
jgi:hypothetical protein